MTRTLLPLVLAVSLASCSSGGASSPAALPVVAPSAPASTPSTTPLVPVLHVAGAPASVFTTQGLVRRSAAELRAAQSTNLGNGQIPTVVGATSPYFGTILTEILAWADNAQNVPVAETSFNAVPANAVSGPVSVVSIGQDNGNLFASTFFDWVTQLGITRVGKGNVVATFGDGTTGQIPVFIYDEWFLTCGSVVDVSHPMEWAYTAGVPKGVFGATSDMTVDCTGLTVTFTNGATQSAQPAADAWGNVASALTTVSTGTTSASPLTVAVASLKLGAIYIAKLSDGGYAKIMALSSNGTGFAPNISGISLHDSPSGSGVFAF